MTVAIAAGDIATKLGEAIPSAVVHASGNEILVRPEALLDAARWLRDTPEYSFDCLVSETGVDYVTHFEVIYHLVSLAHNHSLVMKVRPADRANPALPSAVSVWRSADFQEREIYDLMGIGFQGHPNLSRIMLWEGFPGHPLRKDFLTSEALRS
jgi:NADH-quinone oxidoreductase subunit C